MAFVIPFIDDADQQPLVQVGELPQSLTQDIEIESQGIENLGIGLECDLRSCVFRFPDFCFWGATLLIAHFIYFNAPQRLRTTRNAQ